jgi:hypothetical protein
MVVQASTGEYIYDFRICTWNSSVPETPEPHCEIPPWGEYQYLALAFIPDLPRALITYVHSPIHQ